MITTCVNYVEVSVKVKHSVCSVFRWCANCFPLRQITKYSENSNVSAEVEAQVILHWSTMKREVY